MNSSWNVVVFSHLRWNFVFQRPQHVLSRLAKSHRVLFIEEPIATGGADSWEISCPETNLQVCRPRLQMSSGGFSSEHMPALGQMIPALLQDMNVTPYIAWFYSPMAVQLLGVLSPKAVVYDCMDELSAFLHAPPELRENEKTLLQHADVVFTGGPSLYHAKKDKHANVHCFPSSVDAAHFAKARGDIQEPEDQANVPHPRFGFFGVIDERFDVPLVDAVARAQPDWQTCLVGPVVKIDPATLPRHPNIHYFGQKEYKDLPRYLAGWDVCLLPFARNESTRYISPTKTLEYMAAERPIVSTPITDVAEPYGDIVYLGSDAESFTQACAHALQASAAERAERFAKMHSVLARTSWDQTVRQMEARIDDAVTRRAQHARENNVFPAAQEICAGVSYAGSIPPVVVIGAGPTGLSAAYHLGEDALLLERNGEVGGWCRSVQLGGFTFDYAGHIMFSNDPYVHELYEKLLGDNVHWQDREAWIFSKGVHTRYPFQGALYGLPADVIKECIMGAINARFGKNAAGADSANGKASNGDGHNGSSAHGNGTGHGNGNGNVAVLTKKDGHGGNGKCGTGSLQDCCADGILESTARLIHRNGSTKQNGSAKEQEKSENFEQFIHRVWGAGIAKHFAIPYNRKLWAVPLDEMETSWLGGRVPMPDLEEMIEGALKAVPKPMGPNARFGYPLRGGFQALMNAFVPLLRGPMRLNTGVVKVSPGRHLITLNDGTEVPYEQLISTMPLPVLVHCMGDEAPPAVRKAVAGLRYVSVRCVHLGVGRENLTEKHWIYYPEDTVFHRIFVQGNASPYCNPPGGFGLTCEITYSPHKPLPCDGDALIERCIHDCRRVGIFTDSDPVLVATQCDLPHAYVVYDHARPKNVAIISEWLARQDIILAGRYSEWEYYNSDHAFLAGKKAAEKVRARHRTQAMAAV